MQRTTPAAPAVRETLRHLLESETLGRSERARDLLRYLVEREQAGEADRLKGFSIAVDVFGKDAGFDPSTDAVVRVQVGRLRELLQQYYAEEGADDPIRIAIPRGTYVPSYIALASDAAENAGPEPDAPVLPAEAPVSSARINWHLRLFWASMATVLAMLAFLVLSVERPPGQGPDIAARATESQDSAASIAAARAAEMLPWVYIVTDSNDAPAARTAALLRSALAGFDTVRFVARDFDRSAVDPDEAKMHFSFQVGSGPGGSVSVELQNMATGHVLLSRSMPAAEAGQTALDDAVADILSASVPVSGVIYSDIEQNARPTGLTQCLLLNDDYYLDQTGANHRRAYDCLEVLAKANVKSPLVYSELAALHLETVTDKYSYPPDATQEQAMALAHRAIQMGPTSAYAHRAYGFLTSRVGDTAESIRWTRKAYELNTYDLTMAAAYAYALIYSGDYVTGTPIMRRAVEASSAHPSWWDYSLFLGQFMMGDMQAAARATEALATTKRSHYVAARLVAAHETGATQRARALLEELNASYPKFVADPRSTFEKARYPNDLVEKLTGALRRAGVGGGS